MPRTSRPAAARPATPGRGAARPATTSSRGNGDAERRIYTSIFEAVMDRRLVPGTRLPEAALAKLYQVSRAVVRKALQALANDHIVSLRPNQSAVVAVPTPDEVRAVFEARRAVEAALVALAAERASPGDIARLRTHLRREHEAMHRLDQPGWARLASSFHGQVAALARNPVLEGYLAELISRCALVVSLYEPPGNASCEHDEHERIVDCLERREVAEATELMQAHLQALEHSICFDRREETPTLASLLGLTEPD
ncbi:MAG: GntR family transcriptional regulator [Zoogloeaceae bacterium]|nr:GntR family transcriptional regulator [Zoogloeaceae bacterium]